MSSITSDVVEFFARPVQVAQFSSSSTGATTPTTLSIIQIDSNLKNVDLMNKAQGFNAINFTTKLRVTCNADPFLQGRLLIVFVPGNTNERCMADRLLQYMTATQLPRVELDFSTQTTAVIEIPFVYPLPYYNIGVGTADYHYTNSLTYGQFYVFQYGPAITGTGSTTATITAFMSFEDLTLALPGPQSSSGKVSLASRKNRRTIKANNDELSNEDMGPISQSLAGLSMVASAGAKIPVINSIAEPAAWVLEMLSDTARSFGFSNPNLTQTPSLMAMRSNQYVKNADQPELISSLGIKSDNKVIGTSILKGSDLDELSIHHIATTPAYWTSFDWATNVVPGTSLNVLPVTPARFRVAPDPDGMMYLTPAAGILNMFNYWRGSIKFKFKLVKTKYHSGRLIIAFAPVTSSYSGTDLNNRFLIRKVVDIRELTEFEVVIPYYSQVPYLSTYDSLGNLYISVLNSLACPDTAANSIHVIVEVSFCDDIEVAFPGCASGIGIMPCSNFIPQMGGEDDHPGQPEEDPALGPAHMNYTNQPSQLCIGENVKSLRTLLKSYSKFIHRPFGTTALTPARFMGDPAAIYAAGRTNDDTNWSPTFSDGFSYISSLFYMNRGSVNLYVFSPNNTGVLSATVLPASSASRTQSYVDNYVASGEQNKLFNTTVVERTANNGALAVSIPYYSSTPWTLTTYTQVQYSTTIQQYVSRGTTDFGRTARTVVISAGQVNADAADISIYRKAGDDFDLGFFLGFPPTLLITS